MALYRNLFVRGTSSSFARGLLKPTFRPFSTQPKRYPVIYYGLGPDEKPGKILSVAPIGATIAFKESVAQVETDYLVLDIISFRKGKVIKHHKAVGDSVGHGEQVVSLTVEPQESFQKTIIFQSPNKISGKVFALAPMGTMISRNQTIASVKTEDSVLEVVSPHFGIVAQHYKKVGDLIQSEEEIISLNEDWEKFPINPTWGELLKMSMETTKLPPFYWIIALGVGGAILVGNLMVSVVIGLSIPFYLIIALPMSVAKGITYGLMWPIFVPYALGKWLLCKGDEVYTKFGVINKNGLIPHFVPLSRRLFE